MPSTFLFWQLLSYFIDALVYSCRLWGVFWTNGVWSTRINGVNTRNSDTFILFDNLVFYSKGTVFKLNERLSIVNY